MDTIAILTKKIATLHNQEDFLNASAGVACWYAYTLYKTGKWDREQFNKALKKWWRHNHPLSEPEIAQKEYLDMIQEVFSK